MRSAQPAALKVVSQPPLNPLVSISPSRIEKFPNPGATTGITGSPKLGPGVSASIPAPVVKLNLGTYGAPGGKKISPVKSSLTPDNACHEPHPFSPPMSAQTEHVF